MNTAQKSSSTMSQEETVCAQIAFKSAMTTGKLFNNFTFHLEQENIQLSLTSAAVDRNS